MQTLLTSQQITKKFGQDQILNGIDLEIRENSFTAILGPSGSGKSTLLNVLSGLVRPTSGAVRHEGVEISGLNEKKLADWKRTSVGHVFQSYMLLNNLNAEENIKIGIAPGRTPLAFDRLVSMLELTDILKKFPAQLSGGQQQRVAIARAVIKNPSLVFCDEATGALDEANSKAVVSLLHQLKSSYGITVLFTTHNQQIARTADRVLTIKDGRLHKDIENKSPIAAEDMDWG